MSNRILHTLTVSRRLLVVGAGLAAVAGPVAIGILNAPRSQAQTQTEAATPLTFEVASVKPAAADARGTQIRLLPGGGFSATNVHVRTLIEIAYEVFGFQISGGPDWINSQGFDILANPPESTSAIAPAQMTDPQRDLFRKQVSQRLQALLAERFQLVVHKSSKEMPVYALVIGKNGHKLKEVVPEQGGRQGISMGRGELTGMGAPMAMLVNQLSRVVGRPALDKTGLAVDKKYDFRLEFTPDLAEPGGPIAGPQTAPTAVLSGPSLFTAIQEQLGMRLESTRGPVETILIDRIEKPTEN